MSKRQHTSVTCKSCGARNSRSNTCQPNSVIFNQNGRKFSSTLASAKFSLRTRLPQPGWLNIWNVCMRTFERIVWVWTKWTVSRTETLKIFRTGTSVWWKTRTGEESLKSKRFQSSVRIYGKTFIPMATVAEDFLDRKKKKKN